MVRVRHVASGIPWILVYSVRRRTLLYPGRVDLPFDKLVRCYKKFYGTFLLKDVRTHSENDSAVYVQLVVTEQKMSKFM